MRSARYLDNGLAIHPTTYYPLAHLPGNRSPRADASVHGKGNSPIDPPTEVIATASGIYVSFYDSGSGRTRVERFDGGERGDGACCLAGLSVASIFSLVERKPNPKISIFAYPTIRRISLCANSQEAIGYLCCTFAGTEYLLAQTTYPDFRLIVWHWSTGERLATIEARNVDLTTIVCSKDLSRLVAQLTPSTGMLSVYRILACSRIVRLHRCLESRCERKPRILSCCWFSEAILLCCDEFGNVWSVDYDETEEERRIQTIFRTFQDEENGRLRTNPVLVAHAGGVLITIDLSSTERDRDVQATFYRKLSKDRNEKWSSIWSISLPSYPKHAESVPRRDRILILGENGDLYEIFAPSHHRPPRLEFLLRYDAPYKTILPLSGPHFAILNRADRLTIVDASTGSLVSSKELAHHGTVVQLISHPSLPLLASCSDEGNCLLVEADAPSSPKIASCVHLQRETLDRVKFSEGGRLLGVAASSIARLFLLTSNAKVAVCLNVRRKVVDFLVYETTNDDQSAAKVLVLVGESNDSLAGREIQVYACRFSGDFYEHVDHQMKLSSSFESLHYGREGSHEILGVPCLAKQLYRIELKNDFREAARLEALPSLHQIRGIAISAHRPSTNLLTCGFDGLIVFALFAAHHRTEGGVDCAIFTDAAIVSLGRNGDLVGNKLPSPPSFDDRRTLGRGDSRSTSFTVRANEDWTEETWMEAANIRRQSMYEETRLSILNDWNEVKNRVKELLDENEAAPENARLPISAFDLDQEARKRKLAEARSKEELLVKDAEERVARHDRASRYFRETFLDSLTVKPRSIFSLFARSKVTNYPLAKLAPEDTDRLSWCRFSMEMREMVSRYENSEDSRSSSSHPGFVEILEACTVAEHRERELKARFNERFEKTRSRKKSEMRAANERVERTRRIVDELASTFGVDARSNLLEDAPRWHPIELLEEEEEEEEEDPIVDVKTEENEEGTETEGDDFHREALQRTMDGVLEPRLEDNAKRNIPVPDCLLRTKCATEEDVRAIESYEKKLRVQEEDRGRYKTMLEAELERIKEEFWKSAKAFDDELHELSAEKMRTVERSILAERLKKVQAILQHRRIVEGKREIQRKVELELVPATKEVRKLSEDCDLFEAAVAELRNRYESVRKGEKLVDGKFRAELADLKTSSTEEHLFRHYRRRPRLLEAGCSTSVAFLAELASCLVEQRYSEILPRECSAYLRRMDELDRMPEGLSSRLEPDHWRAVCRLRRLKLEAETKARSCAIELAEAEQSLTFMRNACSIGRNTANRCKQEIEREEKSLADLSNDREVSLFLKAGQLYMEAKEACPRTDWEHAVFIPREELTRANEAIAEAERRRSVALEKLENIEKTVALEEWRHARVKMTMEDLQEEAKDLELFKVRNDYRQRLSFFPSSFFTPRSIHVLASYTLQEIVEAVERERSKLKRTETETERWRRRNARLTEEIDRSIAERCELADASRDPLRSRVAVFQRRRIKAIRRKARLARLIEENAEELSSLKNRLEISKLRTYPTLRMKR
ncbi:WD repeat-containing protein 96 [Habropoda laboriosa]|uniref:WD repeat-containing protein 96 n=1 Tax=Habropoda laboriosa TaxID=597456 RepID=A0A0L7QKV4_9HYME|nr:WD repeat-containing protein 96 [Habropoda laboriosa]